MLVIKTFPTNLQAKYFLCVSSPFVCLQQLFAYTTANLYLNQLVQPFLSTIFVYSTNFCVQPLNQPFSSHFHPPIFATHTYFFRQQLLQPFFFQPIQPTVLLFHSTANLASLLFCHPLCQPTTTSAKQFHFSFHPVFLPSFPPPPAIFLVRLFVFFLLQSLRGSSVEDRLSLVLVNSVTC